MLATRRDMDIPRNQPKQVKHSSTHQITYCMEEIHCVKNLDPKWECKIQEPDESCELCFARYLEQGGSS